MSRARGWNKNLEHLPLSGRLLRHCSTLRFPVVLYFIQSPSPTVTSLLPMSQFTQQPETFKSNLELIDQESKLSVDYRGDKSPSQESRSRSLYGKLRSPTPSASAGSRKRTRDDDETSMMQLPTVTAKRPAFPVRRHAGRGRKPFGAREHSSRPTKYDAASAPEVPDRTDSIAQSSLIRGQQDWQHVPTGNTEAEEKTEPAGSSKGSNDGQDVNADPADARNNEDDMFDCFNSMSLGGFGGQFPDIDVVMSGGTFEELDFISRSA